MPVAPSRRAVSNLKPLAAHLSRLGARHWAQGRSLSIEMLDLDLAGTSEPWRRPATQLRILRERADRPRIELRDALSANGQTLRRATETFTGMKHLGRIAGFSASDPLVHETRRLDDWFDARFIEGRPVP